MPRIRLEHVIYDARHRGYRAIATIEDRPLPRHLACFWPGPHNAGFRHVTRGLVHEATRKTH